MQTKREHRQRQRQWQRQTADIAQVKSLKEVALAQRAPPKSIIMLQNTSKNKEKKKHTHSKLETVTLPRPHADNKQHAMFQNSFITIASQRECGCVWECVCVSQLINCLHLWCFFWLSQKRKWLEKPRLPLCCRALRKFRGCVTVCVCADCLSVEIA